MSDEPPAAEARELVEEVEHGSRLLPAWLGRKVAFYAALWSLFQLALPVAWSEWFGLPQLSSETIRSVHLAFAVYLVFICFPPVRPSSLLGRLGDGAVGRFLRRSRLLLAVDVILAYAGAALVLRYAWLAPTLTEHTGNPTIADYWCGWALVVLLLLAAWRSLGPFLPLVTLAFILVCFNTEWLLPDAYAIRNLTNTKFIDQMSLSSEGIYGIPLGVAARMVFLFVLFGALLEQTGGGKWFTDLAFAAVGRFRGGPGMAAVLASGLTGMVSDSSIANTVTTGTFTIPTMKRAGYPPVKAGAIEVAASTNGQLMPPIMGAAAFIIAELASKGGVKYTYFDVVRAAFIPAVISYLALIWITRIEALKLDLKPLPRELLPPFWRTFARGLHFLLPVAFLIVELMVFRQSPEKAVFWAILVLVGVMVVRHLLFADASGRRWPGRLLLLGRGIWRGLVNGGRNMMAIGVAVAVAGIIVGLVNKGLGGKITELIGALAGGHLLPLLLLTALASLVLGMGLPTTANYIVMATLTVPIIQRFAPPELQLPAIAAHLFCFFFGILADDTPPVGLAAYAASAISKADPIRTGVQGFTYDLRTAVLPFMFFFNHELLLIGVDGFWHGAAIFACGTVAMFAFASATQRWFVVRCRWHEVALLGVVTLILLRPDLVTGWPRWAVMLAGLLVYVAVLIAQLERRAPARRISS